MVNLKKLAMISTLIGAVALGGFYSKKYFVDRQTQNTIYLQAGELKYSNGKELKSSGFTSCSVLILDYNNTAVMAHAIPSDRDNDMLSLIDHINSENVVERALQKLRSRSVNSKNIEALVNAGTKESYQRIVNDLKTKGIRIRSESFSNEAQRDISYNPKNDEISVIQN